MSYPSKKKNQQFSTAVAQEMAQEMAKFAKGSQAASDRLKEMSDAITAARNQANSFNKARSRMRPVLWDADEHDAVMEIVLAAQQWALLDEYGADRLRSAVVSYEKLVGSDAAFATAIGSLMRIKEDLENDGRGDQELPGD